MTCPLLSGYQKKLKWMIDIEMKWIRLYSFKIDNKCFQSPSLGQMLPFCRFDCPFVAYGTVEVTIERIEGFIHFLFRKEQKLNYIKRL